MSDKPASDLDIFSELAKKPVPSRRSGPKKTLVGLNAPAPPLPPTPAPSAAGIAPASAPPLPPSVSSSRAGSDANDPLLALSLGADARANGEADGEFEDAEEATAIAPPLDELSPPVVPMPAMSPQPTVPGSVSGPAAFDDDDDEDSDPFSDSGLGLPMPSPRPLSSRAGPPPAPPPLSPPPSPPRPSGYGMGGASPGGPTLHGFRQPPMPPAQETWDDSDEQTTIYDGGQLPGLGPTGSSWTAAGVPPPPMSRPPAALPIPAMPEGIPSPSMTGLTPAVSRATLYVVSGIATVALLALALVIILKSRSGELTVTVAGPNNEEISQVEVFLDGRSVCTKSTCRLEKVEAGTHTLKAIAPGFKRMAETALTISSGAAVVRNLQLERDPGTGMRVSAHGKGLKLFVDGQEIGPLPQELRELTPGEHSIKVSGSPRYGDFEQTVTVREDEMQVIGPLKLRVLEGLARIEEGANSSGASVILDVDGDRRTMPQLPMTLEIDTSKPHRLTAAKRGFKTYAQDLSFENGDAERTFVIALEPEGQDEPKAEAKPAPTPAPRVAAARASRPSPRPEAKKEAEADEPAAAPTKSSGSKEVGKLNLNAIPRATVLLDGRPIGSTPKIGIEVSAGQHTIVFVAGDLRKSQTVTIGAGETKTVAPRLTE